MKSFIISYRSIPKTVFLLSASALFSISVCGCSLPDILSTNPDAGKKPVTSTLIDRKDYLSSSLFEPEEEKPDETTVTFRLTAQFVLHVDGNNRVTDFEALNNEAHTLKNKTKKEWNNKPCKKALRSILEQCVIDGYISDAIPVVDISVSSPESPVAKKTAAVTEEVLSDHGISTEIDIH